MISDLEPMAGTKPQPPFVRLTGDEFQIGDFLIRRFRGDRFLIWNRDNEMMGTEGGKLESALRDFFDEEF
jgi:hypothetical protein